MSQVGVDEAKTHLPRLLQQVAGGERISITKHGHSVAVLQPVEGSVRRVVDVINDMKQFRHGKRLQSMSIREMIEEGRD
ncbi:MAG: type II toxin-antitoxin system prevent-host-death family antitoxin [Mariprofundus sp.]|nr:type II toxin-antitoxin system prevent-host-death family antitoxin [Mariprofundus sp.]